MAVADPTGRSLQFLVREVIRNSAFGWFAVVYPVVFGILFIDSGSSFSFLYWSAKRCRNEGGEVALPEAAREDSRQ